MPPDSLILSFDTSAAHCAVALFSSSGVMASRYEERRKGQAEHLMPLVENVLHEAGAGFGDLAAVGVGIGPGNFTGIRISVSAARGLALARGIPAIGVSMTEVLGAGHDTALSCVDARQNKVYLQLFEARTAVTDVQLFATDRIPARIARPGLIVIGDHASLIAETLGATALAFDPAEIAPRIARIAFERKDEPHPRPAPLYVRAPDAAPPRDPAPVILDR